jgi:hypothetical protein|tara:strand:+ start:55 stop:282 length:228 start_codon:yes stop_codon:yes gene_type:complete
VEIHHADDRPYWRPFILQTLKGEQVMEYKKAEAIMDNWTSFLTDYLDDQIRTAPEGYQEKDKTDLLAAYAKIKNG